MIRHLYIKIVNVIYTVVGDNINIRKTTFDLNFDFYKAFKQAWVHKNMKIKRSCQLKKLLFNYL